MTYRSLLRFACIPVLVVLAAMPAFAHHSFNAYDMSKSMPMSGTIKEFRWGAPHSSMVLMYMDKAGQPAQMAITSGSPLTFLRQGFQSA